MDNFIENFVENFEVNSGIKNWHDESGPGTFGDNFRHISRTISRTIGGTISWTISGQLTSYNRTHSLYQHISGIKNGHDESGPRKPYDISCATLRTFNINICVSFLLFVYPTLNAGLVDPFCRAPAPKNKIVINKSKSYTCLIFCGKLFWYDITICWDEILLLFPNEKKKPVWDH